MAVGGREEGLHPLDCAMGAMAYGNVWCSALGRIGPLLIIGAAPSYGLNPGLDFPSSEHSS